MAIDKSKLPQKSLQITLTPEQKRVFEPLNRVFEIFSKSRGKIRPHFILAGASGSGKNVLINELSKSHKVKMIEINAAQLTKEGFSGASLSRVLKPLQTLGDVLNVVFVDEFDKLFISGNSNSDNSLDVCRDVQNEFLRAIEAEKFDVLADFGQYATVSTKNTLFVFAGAFNNTPNVSLDILRDTFKVKNEFLGRVGLVFNTHKPSLESLLEMVKTSPLLDQYLRLFTDANKDHVVDEVSKVVIDSYENNSIGARTINTMFHRFFIHGELTEEIVEESSFSETMSLLTKDEDDELEV